MEEFSVEEFLELKVFCDKFEPFGDSWRQTAFLAAILVNSNPYRSGEAVTAERMLRAARGIREPLPGPEELEAKLTAALKML